MKLSVVCSVVLAAFFATPAFANDPSMSNQQNQTGTTNMNPGREKWTRERMAHLRKRNKDHKTNGYPGGDGRNPFSYSDNPYLTGDDAALRRRDAIKRQHEIDQIEFLML